MFFVLLPLLCRVKHPGWHNIKAIHRLVSVTAFITSCCVARYHTSSTISTLNSLDMLFLFSGLFVRERSLGRIQAVRQERDVFVKNQASRIFIC